MHDSTGVEDFRLALHEYDRRAALRLRAQYTDLRNTVRSAPSLLSAVLGREERLADPHLRVQYAVVLDILEKNMKRIAQPKSGSEYGAGTSERSIVEFRLSALQLMPSQPHCRRHEQLRIERCRARANASSHCV